MKKLIIIILSALIAVSASAQIRYSIGADYTYDPNLGYSENIAVRGHQYGVSGTVATEISNSFYAGIGVGLSNYTMTAKASGLSVSDNLFILPVYVDIYRVQSNSLYFNIKIGAAFEFQDNTTDTALYFNIIPIGWTFNNISVGLGYRCISEDNLNINGLNIALKYNF